MSLIDDPRIYNAIQVLAGRHVTSQRLQNVLSDTSGMTVLDVGAGTGNLARSLPPRAVYWALDNDPAKLLYLKRKLPDARCILRSAVDTGLKDDAVDWSVCVTVAHHLDDEQLPLVIAEMSRVTRGSTLFVDALWTGKRGVQRLIWRYDRGYYPRSEDTLLHALRVDFHLEHVARFRMIQDYLLCVGQPIRNPAALRNDHSESHLRADSDMVTSPSTLSARDTAA